MKKALTILSFFVILSMSFTLAAQGTPGDGTVTMPTIPIPQHTTEASSEEDTTDPDTTEPETDPPEPDPTNTDPSEPDSSEPDSSESDTSETESTSATLPEESTDYEATGISFTSESTNTYDISSESISNIAVASVKPCQLNVSWNVLSPKVSGYQIQVSTDAAFSAPKTFKVQGAAESGVVVYRLQRGQTYYVRVRAYADGQGGTSYSKWSRTKNATVQTR